MMKNLMLAASTSLISLLISSAAFAQTATPGADSQLLSQGAYLATAADCTACHTKQGGEPYAGGYQFATPMGIIYSSNITPSKTSGIGNYTEEQFAKALRLGIRADGTHLYPAMPYTAYAKLNDNDIHALYTYFMQEVRAVDQTPPKTELPFPFNQRYAIAAWNALFLDTTQFKPDPNKSAQWNRGAFIAEALEHCSMCHSPRNFFMAEESSKHLGGGPLGAWYAPNITSDTVSGIGNWTEDELVQYFQTGNLPGKAQAAGSMGEAIEHSLQHLSRDDLLALAVYLKATPAITTPGATKPRDAFGTAYSAEAVVRGNPKPSRGDALYSAYCASCHQADGSGTKDTFYPSLYNNSSTGAPNPNNLIATILHGVDRTIGNERYFMPGFSKGSYLAELKDDEVADIANYVLQHYGDDTVKVTSKDVASLRAGGPKPALVVLGALVAPGIVTFIALLAILSVWWNGKRRKKAKAKS